MKKNLSGGKDRRRKTTILSPVTGIDRELPLAQRTTTFQAFLDSLKTPHRKVVKLSWDYATRR